MELGVFLRSRGSAQPLLPPPTGGPGQEVVRWGTGNQPGTAPFDTKLYAGSGPADGTYHAMFSVSGGVISLTAPPVAGLYDVDGWSVEIDPDWKAIGNQAEYNGLGAGDLGAGRKIIFREAASVTDTGGGVLGSPGDKAYTTVEGDGDARAEKGQGGDARRHFTRLYGGRIRNLRLINLRFAEVSGNSVLKLAEIGGTPRTSDIHVERCAIIAGHPDPQGDYSTGWPFGWTVYNNTRVDGFTLKDCYIKGGNYGVQTGGNLWTEIIGCEFDVCYQDFIQSWNDSGADTDTWLIAGCKLSRPMSLDSDPGAPHSDFVQFQGAPTVCSGRVIEFITMQDGNGRGAGQAQTLFLDAQNGIQAKVRGALMMCANTASGFSIQHTNGSVIEHCIDLPHAASNLPLISDLRFGNASATGTNRLKNCAVAIQGNLSASVIQSGNFDLDALATGSDWSTDFPQWDAVDSATSVLSQQELLEAAKPAPDGQYAGKGPGEIFTLGASGELSDYSCSAASPPVLSSVLPTVTPTGFSACLLATDTEGDPVFWAVVPSGLPATAEEIKKRRIGGALGYGVKPVPAGSTGLDLGGWTGGAPATNYDLLIVQWDGYTVESGVLRHSFQTL